MKKVIYLAFLLVSLLLRNGASVELLGATKSLRHKKHHKIKVKPKPSWKQDEVAYSLWKNIVSDTLEGERKLLFIEILKLWKLRYKWGGEGKNGIDCSAFMQKIFKKVDIILPRTSYDMSKLGKEVTELEFGDLVFFNRGRKKIGHVGVYVGSGVFAHSSSKGKIGITFSELFGTDYERRWCLTKRVKESWH